MYEKMSNIVYNYIVCSRVRCTGFVDQTVRKTGEKEIMLAFTPFSLATTLSKLKKLSSDVGNIIMLAKDSIHVQCYDIHEQLNTL